MGRISEAVALLMHLGSPDAAQRAWWRAGLRVSPDVAIEIEAMISPCIFATLAADIANGFACKRLSDVAAAASTGGVMARSLGAAATRMDDCEVDAGVVADLFEHWFGRPIPLRRRLRHVVCDP